MESQDPLRCGRSSSILCAPPSKRAWRDQLFLNSQSFVFLQFFYGSPRPVRLELSLEPISFSQRRERDAILNGISCSTPAAAGAN